MIMSTGRWWQPDEDDRLALLDVGRGLADKQRVGGMLPVKWTVLHHTIALYRALREIYPEGDPNFWLCVLMHDGHEFIMGDMPMPIKTHARRLEEAQMQMGMELDMGIRRFTNIGVDETRLIKAIDRLETEHEGWQFFKGSATNRLREKWFRPASVGGSIDHAIDDVYFDYPNTQYSNEQLLWHWIDLVLIQIRLLDAHHDTLIS